MSDTPSPRENHSAQPRQVRSHHTVDSTTPRFTIRGILAAALTLGLAAAPLVAPVNATPASANAAGSDVIINEVYLKAGSANAAYNTKFIELYNPTDSAVSLAGWSIQYRASTNISAVTGSGIASLSGTIPATGYFLVSMSGNGAVGADLPAPDQSISLAPSGTTGQIFLSSSTAPVTAGAGNVAGTANIKDMLGYGAAATFEGAPVPVTGANAVPNSLARTNFIDTDNNLADFTHPATITPQSSTSPTPPVPPVDPPGPVDPPTTVTIAQVQGSGDQSPLAGQTVKTTGVVTATYPTGGFNGYYIQTPGTGGSVDASSHAASDALFVSSPNTVASVAIGDYVQVTGVVSEYFGLTQIAVAGSSDLTKLSTPATAPSPALVELPANAEQRESFEGMLLAPRGDFTVSSTYTTNQYAEIGLASGTSPLITPTEIARPGTPEYTAAIAANGARAVTLDDGSSANFLTTAKNTPLPYVSTEKPVSVGGAVTFNSAVIFDYRNNAWKFQPTTQLTATNAGTVQPASFSNVRTDSPASVGGDITLASFNVLNYFTTTGDSVSGCTFYTDRDGNKITVNSGCDARGAADAANLARQQAKIVSAISALGADVVSLEEIENSAKFGKNRDSALKTLTDALNDASDAAGDGKPWDYVRSPSALPPIAQEDVIRTAFIYKKDEVTPVGDSQILLTGTAFNNARRPLAQQFAELGKESGDTFIAIANHFKSKGSGSGADADTGDGQGASNASRVAQATALAQFSSDLQSSLGTDKVFLLGDFNAYTQEDPIATLALAGYTDLGSATGKYSYSFSGASGSLDHVLASAGALSNVSGTDIWNINSGESIALEYSRYNYNATNFYEANPYRSSDHDPIIVGIDLNEPVKSEVEINLLNINDFHGRIDGNTVKFAGTIEALKAEKGEANTLMLSDGDNIGASLFASSSKGDQPTIDLLNILGLKASAVGNHEFDTGFADLNDRIIGPAGDRNAKFDYLGANVYEKGTTTPAMDEYAIFEVDGVKVGVIGAVTEETPSLVSLSGIADLSFGDPVAAVNRVAAQLSDGDPANGEADVIVAEYHEGAGAGTPDGANLLREILAGGAFARIVTVTSPDVDAIFTGHTHKQYAWDASIPGVSGKTRPVLQTGSYGENIGQVVLAVDSDTKDVTNYTARNVPRTTTSDTDLVSTYPRVAQVKTVVDKALADAAIVGNEVIGSVSNDITTAFAGGSYVDGKYTGGNRDNRGAESSLGNLVADSLVSSLGSADRGGATIGVVNPGGLRSDLRYGANGEITYAGANAVLPFVNNLWTTSLTGAQFKAVLEQQWQTDAQGKEISSRPFLKLGLSQNVQYTFDSARAQGDRVTGVWVDGKQLNPTASYRIGSFSFLLEGGDNFREFKNGTDAKDSGLIDRDAWIDYLKAHPKVAPSFARLSASVTDVTASPVKPGAAVSAKISGLDLTSLGSPQNKTLSAAWVSADGTPSIPLIDGVTVAEGAANLAVTVPARATSSGTIVVTAQPSGTVVKIPVEVTVGPIEPENPEKPSVDPVPVTEDKFTAAKKNLITVSPDVVAPGDTITVYAGSTLAKTWISVWMHSTPVGISNGWTQVPSTGAVSARIPEDATPGVHRVVVLDSVNNIIGWTEVTVASSSPLIGGAGSSGATGPVSSATLTNTGAESDGFMMIGAFIMLAAGFVFLARRRTGGQAAQ